MNFKTFLSAIGLKETHIADVWEYVMMNEYTRGYLNDKNLLKEIKYQKAEDNILEIKGIIIDDTIRALEQNPIPQKVENKKGELYIDGKKITTFDDYTKIIDPRHNPDVAAFIIKNYLQSGFLGRDVITSLKLLDYKYDEKKIIKALMKIKPKKHKYHNLGYDREEDINMYLLELLREAINSYLYKNGIKDYAYPDFETRTVKAMGITIYDPQGVKELIREVENR